MNLSEIAKKLLKEKRVALISHVRPDGDTLGSSLALKLALESINIQADVVCDDSVPQKFFFLDEANLVKKELCGEYGALIAIDCADISRLGSFSEAFIKHQNTFVIDHHISNNRYAKNNYVFDNSSNAENILALIELMGISITSKIANLLAMGIVTDTGNFRHKNVTENTLVSAGKLVSLGADLNNIYFHMFTKQSKARAKLFGSTMQKLRYFFDDRFAVATVLQSDIEKACARQDETEGFIDFVMGINGVEVGACVLETAKNKFKISFRSKGTDVNGVAQTFGGGGHTLASGCQIQGEYEEVVDKICFAVSRYLPD